MNGQEEWFQQIVARAAILLSAPSEDFPSVRCVARPDLVELFNRIQDDLNVPSTHRLSGSGFLAYLVRTNLAQPVPLDKVASEVRQDRFYMLGLGVNPLSVDPVELLQAHVKQGVVCYFTALTIHGLTTQTAAHHHIAHLNSLSLSASRSRTRVLSQQEGAGRKAPPVGQWQFTYQGIPYYRTNRDPRYLRGVQTRYLHERTRFRLTNIEQTLIDTLHRPMNCGGPAVVFEAWEAALNRVQPHRLSKLLQEIDDETLTRRTGYMMDKTGYTTESELADYLDTVRLKHIADDDQIIEPLFVGIPYTQVDSHWRLWVP